MTANPARLYAFSIRPRHLETLKSYSIRVLAKNFDDSAFDDFRFENRGAALHRIDDEWAQILGRKTGRNLIRLLEPTLREAHEDGADCLRCVGGARYLCTLCAYGETIEQHSHFESNVCIRHGRWTGPGTELVDQIVGGAELISAERTFRRLRARGEIDMHLFTVLSKALQLNWNRSSPSTTYPILIRLVESMRRKTFLRTFFDPSLSFADAYAVLEDLVRRSVSRDQNAVTRALWLYFRPTFLSLREARQTGTEYVPANPHDFAVPTHIANARLKSQHPLEPFENYLAPSGDATIGTKNYWVVLRHEAAILPDPKTANSRPVATICRHGHRTERTPQSMLLAAKKAKDNCAVCLHRDVIAGTNDIATTHPQVSSEWNTSMNEKPITEVTSGSNYLAHWVCPKGHRYRATVGDRTRGAGCRICAHIERSGPGSSLRTAHPDLAAEFAVAENAPLTIDDLTTGSRRSVYWTCGKRHVYEQRVERRTSGYGCPICSGRQFEKGVNDFATRHPHLTAEWHGNGSTTASDIMPGSNTKYWWKCNSGHVQQQSAPNRILSNGCPKCDPDQRRGPE